MRFFREILYEVVKLIGLAGLALPFPADVVEQFVHKDQRGAVREKRLDHVAARRDSLLIVASYHAEGFGSAELPGDLSQGVWRFGSPPVPPRPVSGSNFWPTKMAVAALGTALTWACCRIVRTPCQSFALGPA